MSLDIDERLEQKKLELYKKHGLDGSMSDEEVANKIRSLSSNKVRQQLLNDFKVQIRVPTINGKNYRNKNCKEMIDSFLEHRNEGFPRLRRQIMSPAERKAEKAAKKALKLQYEHAKEVIDTFNSLVACADAAVSTTEEEICQGCSKVLPRRDQHYVCFSCKHKFKSKFCGKCEDHVCNWCKHKFCEECEIDNLDMCPACEKRFCQKCLDVCSSCKHKFCGECEDMCPFCEERFCQKCDDLSGIGCRQCQDAALKFGFM